MKNSEYSSVGKSISKAVFMRFLYTLLAAVGLLILVYFVSGIILSQFILWQEDDVLYRLFKFIERNGTVILTMCGFSAFVVIFGAYWRKTLGYIDTIVEAGDVLISPDDKLIRLPAELKQVEVRMNEAKQAAVRNAAIAKEAEQRKNDMVMYLAHDIKTPLTSVIGYLSLLNEATDMPMEQKAKYIGITLEKANRLERLVDEFFEITRYNFQTIKPIKESIDLSYMITQMSEEFYPQLSVKNKRIVSQISDDTMIYGDPEKLARVFNNILKNAAAYSPDGSAIIITADISGDAAIISFKNDGGIPKDKLLSIFDKFYRLDSARSSNYGSGLGLAIAKEIVTLHGGKIYADSDGKQTMFTVELPNNTN